MQQITVKALVLRSADYGEYDKMLTLLCEGMGKISVCAKGAKSLKDGRGAATQCFCYGEYVISEKNGRYMFVSANPQEAFLGLSQDIEKLSCATEMLKFADRICPPGEPCDEMLRVLLNSLYALANLNKSVDTAKTVFYLKSLIMLGIEPELDACCACGNEENITSFCDEYGGVLCSQCAAMAEGTKRMLPDSLALMKYVSRCDMKKMFSFTAPQNVLENTYEILKSFIKNHLDLNI